MTQRTVLITEGNTAFARTVAVKFAKEGANIVLSCDVFDDMAMHTKFLVESMNSDCLLMIGDINDQTYCKETMWTIKTKYNKLDVLINNSFTSNLSLANLPGPLREKLLEISRLNVFTYQKLTEAAVKIMEPNGCIINHQIIENGWNNKKIEKENSINESVKVFTEFFSKRLEEKGIRSNAIVSYTTVTGKSNGSMNFENGFYLLKRNSEYQRGCPFSFLTSDKSLDINGEILLPEGLSNKPALSGAKMGYGIPCG